MHMNAISYLITQLPIRVPADFAFPVAVIMFSVAPKQR
jgi:hypothetical protein